MNRNEIKEILENGTIDEILTNLQNYYISENCKIDFYRNQRHQLVAEICFIHAEKFESHGHIEFCHEYIMSDKTEWKNFKRCVYRIINVIEGKK